MFPSKLWVGMVARVDKTRVARGGIYGGSGRSDVIATLTRVDYVLVLAVDAELQQLLEDLSRYCARAQTKDGPDLYAATWHKWRCPILVAAGGVVGWLHREDVESLEHV